MGNTFRTTKPKTIIPEPVTPYSLSTNQPTTSRSTATDFEWGNSGSKQIILNFLGRKIQNISTSEQFTESFHRHMKIADITNIKELFNAIEFTLPQTVDALHFYTAINCGFSDVFYHELTRSKHLFGEPSEICLGPFMEKHCRGALITHCFIVKNLDNVTLVDETLNAIASSHVFLSKLSLAVKKHDEILYKFLKYEFSQYKPKEIFASLHKYLKILSTRTQVLIEKKVQLRSMADMNEGMDYLKNIQNIYQLSYMTGSIRELFRCDSSNSNRESLIIPFTRRTISVPSIESASSFISTI